MAEGGLSRREVEEKIVALAWKDDDFRKRFLANPKAEFERQIGVKLPPGLQMTAYQEDGNSLHFVIPAKPKAGVGELSDADLEKVAGGVDIVTLTIAGAAALAWGAGTAAISVLATEGKGDWRK